MGLRGLSARILSVVLAGWNLSLILQTARAQNVQFWPEVDAHVSLTKTTRLWLQADRIREEGTPTQNEIGPSLEVFLKPLLRLRDRAKGQPDKSKSRTLTLTMGYRYLTYAKTSPENRLVFEANPRFPLAWKVVVTE